MDKESNIYCLFEQSGSFKNAFKRAGFEKVIDIDIKNSDDFEKNKQTLSYLLM